jgi:hypothetical protein
MFNIPIIIDNFPRHDTLKDRLLDLINQQQKSTIKSHGEKISNADWNDLSENKDYVRLIGPIAQQTVTKFLNRMNYKECKAGRIWYQQYETSDFHSWHRHEGTDWNFVYYLELADDAPPTEFRNPMNAEQTYTPTVKEGQFVLFPSLLEHRSSANLSTKRKTIIAINYIAI